MLRRSRPQDVRYRGDWMRRPVGSNEVGWLVRLLLALSDRLNHALYLDGRELPAPREDPTSAQVRPGPGSLSGLRQHAGPACAAHRASCCLQQCRVVTDGIAGACCRRW